MGVERPKKLVKANCIHLLQITPNAVANITKKDYLAGDQDSWSKISRKLATRTLWILYILSWYILQLNKTFFKGDELVRTPWSLLSKTVTNVTKQTCEHPPSWIFKTLCCILAFNFLTLATTLKNLGTRRLLEKWFELYSNSLGRKLLTSLLRYYISSPYCSKCR